MRPETNYLCKNFNNVRTCTWTQRKEAANNFKILQALLFKPVQTAINTLVSGRA